MDLGFIEKTAVSAVAVGLMVALAAWARIARPTPGLDADQVRALCAVEFPGLPVGQVWIAADRQGAIARSVDQALLIFRLGDGYVARSLAWSQALAAKVEAGRMTLRLNDIGAPRASFAVSDSAPWPPSVGGVL